MDHVFDGWIAGLGTASGDRFVIGCWRASPFGPMADVMHEDPRGRRTLLAPTAEVAEFVSATYRFDAVVVAPVAVAPGAVGPWDVRAGRDYVVRMRADGLTLNFRVGRRSAVGWLLRAVPRPLATSRAWVTAVDKPARVLLRGVRTTGTAGGGRREWYAALDSHRIERARVEVDGVDCGALADVRPPVRFGFGSVPRRPSVTRVRTTVRIT